MVLFNASSDIRQQIAATPERQPAENTSLRSTPISAVVLTNADVDHIAGLPGLRERGRFVVYATARVLAVLAQNAIFNVVDPALYFCGYVICFCVLFEGRFGCGA